MSAENSLAILIAESTPSPPTDRYSGRVMYAPFLGNLVERKDSYTFLSLPQNPYVDLNSGDFARNLSDVVGDLLKANPELAHDLQYAYSQLNGQHDTAMAILHEDYSERFLIIALYKGEYGEKRAAVFMPFTQCSKNALGDIQTSPDRGEYLIQLGAARKMLDFKEALQRKMLDAFMQQEGTQYQPKQFNILEEGQSEMATGSTLNYLRGQMNPAAWIAFGAQGQLGGENLRIEL